jgi:DNA-directed RNA polymerase subunit M/transcription elongation factor TFIIS
VIADISRDKKSRRLDADSADDDSISLATLPKRLCTTDDAQSSDHSYARLPSTRSTDETGERLLTCKYC